MSGISTFYLARARGLNQYAGYHRDGSAVQFEDVSGEHSYQLVAIALTMNQLIDLGEEGNI